MHTAWVVFVLAWSWALVLVLPVTSSSVLSSSSSSVFSPSPPSPVLSPSPSSSTVLSPSSSSVLSSSSSVLSPSSSHCSYTDPSGNHFSLDLGTFSGTEVDSKGQPAYTYKFNLCTVFTEGSCPPGNAFQLSGQGLCMGTIGLNPTVQTIQGGILVNMTNTACCQCTGNVARSTLLTILCGTQTVIPSVPITESKAPNPICQYSGSFYHKNACINPKSKSSGLSPGSIFLIVFFGTIVAYLSIGFVIKWKIQGANPGPESIPQIEVWSQVPGLIVDGLRFTKQKMLGLAGRSYEPVP